MLFLPCVSGDCVTGCGWLLLEVVFDLVRLDDLVLDVVVELEGLVDVALLTL